MGHLLAVIYAGFVIGAFIFIEAMILPAVAAVDANAVFIGIITLLGTIITALATVGAIWLKGNEGIQATKDNGMKLDGAVTQQGEIHTAVNSNYAAMQTRLDIAEAENKKNRDETMTLLRQLVAAQQALAAVIPAPAPVAPVPHLEEQPAQQPVVSSVPLVNIEADVVTVDPKILKQVVEEVNTEAEEKP